MRGVALACALRRNRRRRNLVIVERHNLLAEPVVQLGEERWSRSFGQVFDIFKWNVRGSHAAVFFSPIALRLHVVRLRSLWTLPI
ncbi:hypothetical protein Y025_3857 [Burkholderia pseudomallei TSV32]|nr:hypothetical protein Y025_3857 [Burkholderia pseudomallei TSV32]